MRVGGNARLAVNSRKASRKTVPYRRVQYSGEFGMKEFGFPFVVVEITKKCVTVLSIGMILIVLYGVYRRYLLGSAASWIEELATFLMIWIVFLGFSIAAREKAHVGIFYVKEKVPKNLKRYMNLFIELLVAIFLIVLTYEGVRLAATGYGQTSPALRISYLWAYLSIPVGAMLMIVQVFYSIYLWLFKLED